MIIQNKEKQGIIFSAEIPRDFHGKEKSTRRFLFQPIAERLSRVTQFLWTAANFTKVGTSYMVHDYVPTIYSLGHNHAPYMKYLP